MAAEEIFELFERTIADYEEKLYRNKEENERREHELVATVADLRVRLHKGLICFNFFFFTSGHLVNLIMSSYARQKLRMAARRRCECVRECFLAFRR